MNKVSISVHTRKWKSDVFDFDDETDFNGEEFSKLAKGEENHYLKRE